jgi:environmental stress-induced protein Ves
VAVILRAAERLAVPWKNGGGLTREVAVHPPGSDLGNFDWRVSIAEVHRGGPFSSFPGVDRHMAVISGVLTLSVAGREPLTLSHDGPCLSFPGDVPASAEPRQAPVTDLNVMTRRGRFAARLRRGSVPGEAVVKPESDTTLIVASGPLVLRAPSIECSLSMLDAVRLPASGALLTLRAAGPAAIFWLIEICAL